MLGLVRVQNHLNETFLLVLLDGDLRERCDRDAPLLLAELDRLSWLVLRKLGLRIEEEDHGDDKEPRLVLTPGIGLDQEAVVLHGVIGLELEALLKEALPAHRQVLLEKVRDDEVALVGVAGDLYKWHLRRVIHVFVVCHENEGALWRLQLLNELEVHQLERQFFAAKDDLALGLQLLEPLFIYIPPLIVVNHLRFGLDCEQVYAALRDDDLLQRLLASRIGSLGSLLLRLWLGHGLEGGSAAKHFWHMDRELLLVIPPQVVSLLEHQVLHYLVELRFALHFTDLEHITIDRIREA